MSQLMEFSKLHVGMTAPEASFDVTRDVVDRFRAAVHAAPTEGDIAPSGLAGIYVRPATMQIQPPPGGIYAGQRYVFHRPIRVGQRLRTSGEVEQLFVKNGNRFVVMRTTTVDEHDAPVTTGWSTRIWSR